MPPLPSADALEDAGNNVWARVDDAYVSQPRASPPQSPAAHRDAGASLRRADAAFENLGPDDLPSVLPTFIDGAGYMRCHCHPSILGGMTPEEIGRRVEDRRPGSEFDGGKL